MLMQDFWEGLFMNIKIIETSKEGTQKRRYTWPVSYIYILPTKKLKYSIPNSQTLTFNKIHVLFDTTTLD